MKDYKEAIESIMKDTTSKVMDHAIKAYRQGYEDGKAATPFTDTEEAKKTAYEQGLNDARDVVKKIYDMDGDDLVEVFNDYNPYNITQKYTAAEALAKIKEYEDKQKQFAVGDEVYSDAFDDKGIVTHITADKVSCVCIICNGWTMMKVGANGLHRTGRTFPQIAEVLKQMN